VSETATPFAELQVPDEPGVWFCARHKNVKTRLRCGRCEKPICPKCTVMAPTGARCRDCASNRTSHIYQVGPREMALAFLAAVIMGVVGAMLLNVAGGFSYWLVIYAPVVGPALGKLVTKITGGKRGTKIAATVCSGIFIGGVTVGVSRHLLEAKALQALPPEAAAEIALSGGAMSWLSLIAFLVLAMGGAWWWLKG
jgi:hypothetical protein